jgi:hypothetical protein
VVMPTSAGNTMKDCVEIQNWAVPTGAELDTAFAGNTPPVVMAAPNNANQTTLPRIMFIPKVWAGFFLDRKTPYEAFKVMEALMATLPVQEQRDRALPLMEWTKAICVRAGVGALQRRASVMEVPWETPDLVDRRLIMWATKRLAPYRSPVPVAPAVVPGMFPAGVPFYAPPAPSTVKNYTALEHDKIRGACSMSVVEYNIGVPSIFAEILTEGRTTEKVQAVLQVRFQPDLNSDHPVSIFVSRDMAKDIKELNFGYGGDKDYESCHRGISPFAVIPVSAATAFAKRRAQQRYNQVSHITSADAMAMESSPSQCPTTYDALQRVLLCYIVFLRKLFRENCAHYLEVLAIRRVLSRKVNEYSTMGPTDVAGILWAIFCDARDFFSVPATQNELPTTNLLITRMWLETNSIKVTYNVPTDRLLGFAKQGPEIGDAVVYQPVGGSNADRLFGGSGVKRSVPGPPWVNPSPNASLVQVLKPAVDKNPAVKVIDLLSAGKMRYRDIKVGIPGGCIDMVMLGICKSADCAYSHASQDPLPAAKIPKLTTQLTKAVAAYVAKP